MSNDEHLRGNNIELTFIFAHDGIKIDKQHSKHKSILALEEDIDLLEDTSNIKWSYCSIKLSQIKSNSNA